MKQIFYAMQFNGQAGPGNKEGTMVAKTTSDSCRITSTVQDTGLAATLEQVAGGQASFESVVTLTGESSFLESGSIHFGGRHSLRFSTVGQGYLGSSADPSLKHGTVNWRVDSGDGQFEGATGLITSNFTVGPNGEVVDNHFGLIFLK
ncbi:MAG TPA: hypothetical protein VKE70_26575 [Candidatus Solibacter sp.]|nr:hypothetical protein [Candidatus Solibacter sp.]